jgi:hypothetical protein
MFINATSRSFCETGTDWDNELTILCLFTSPLICFLKLVYAHSARPAPVARHRHARVAVLAPPSVPRVADDPVPACAHGACACVCVRVCVFVCVPMCSTPGRPSLARAGGAGVFKAASRQIPGSFQAASRQLLGRFEVVEGFILHPAAPRATKV